MLHTGTTWKVQEDFCITKSKKTKCVWSIMTRGRVFAVILASFIGFISFCRWPGEIAFNFCTSDIFLVQENINSLLKDYFNVLS